MSTGVEIVDVPLRRQPRRSMPFKRLALLFAAVNAAVADLRAAAHEHARGQTEADRLKADESLLTAREALFGYRSRGKGRGTPSRRYGNKTGKYSPHQGARECARRVWQMGGES